MMRIRAIQWYCFALAGLCAGLAPCAAVAAPNFGEEWNWALPPRLYGQLSQNDRMQFEGAEKLIREKSYEAAALEFEKFLAQNKKTPARAHALLLQGYSYHLARKRGKAIALYTELLDFYADSIDQAVPGAYLRARAEMENGNIARGIEHLRDLVNNTAYHAHALADRALYDLAMHELREGKGSDAEKHLELIIDLFVSAFMRPSDTAKRAHAELARLFVREGRYGALEKLLEQPVPYIQNMGDLKARADYAYGLASGVMASIESRPRKRFFEWFRDQRKHYESGEAVETYFNKAASLAVRIEQQDEWRAIVDEMLEFVMKQPDKLLASSCANLTGHLMRGQGAGWNIEPVWDPLNRFILERGDALPDDRKLALYGGVGRAMGSRPKNEGPLASFWDILIARMADIYVGMTNPERDKGLAGLVDSLVGSQRFSAAHRMAERMQHTPFMMSKQVGILLAEKKPDQAAKLCEKIEELDNGVYAAAALRIRADLYADILARYADAINLYTMINEPPGTVWSIIDCEEKRGEPAQAAMRCTELENFFPNEAPKAAYRRAMVWHNAKNREKAIAEFRSVLKTYPRHSVSSQAHQMLETYGIATGGGVLEEMK